MSIGEYTTTSDVPEDERSNLWKEKVDRADDDRPSVTLLHSVCQCMDGRVGRFVSCMGGSDCNMDPIL